MAQRKSVRICPKVPSSVGTLGATSGRERGDQPYKFGTTNAHESTRIFPLRDSCEFVSIRGWKDDAEFLIRVHTLVNISPPAQLADGAGPGSQSRMAVIEDFLQ